MGEERAARGRMGQARRGPRGGARDEYARGSRQTSSSYRASQLSDRMRARHALAGGALGAVIPRRREIPVVEPIINTGVVITASVKPVIAEGLADGSAARRAPVAHVGVARVEGLLPHEELHARGGNAREAAVDLHVAVVEGVILAVKRLHACGRREDTCVLVRAAGQRAPRPSDGGVKGAATRRWRRLQQRYVPWIHALLS